MTGPSYVYRAALHRVIDGDSFHLRLDLGFHVGLTVPVRLRGVDTPEMSTAAGKLARTFTSDTLTARPLLVQSYRDRQSFARWVCDVWFENDGVWMPLADTLIAAGHGTPLEV